MASPHHKPSHQEPKKTASVSSKANISQASGGTLNLQSSQFYQQLTGATQGKQPALGCPLRRDNGSSKGYVIQKGGAFITAELSEAVKNCPECLGLGYQHDEIRGVSQYCTQRSPQRIVALYGESRLPVRYLNASFDGKSGGFRNYSGNADRILFQLTNYLNAFPSRFQRPPSQQAHTQQQQERNQDPKGGATGKQQLPKAQHKAEKEGWGLILSGPVGVGKTFLLVAAAKSLIEKGYRVRFVDFFQLISEIQAGIMKKHPPTEILTPLIDTDVLLIDELGKGRNSEFELTILDQIVMGRYNQNKPIMATTNYSLSLSRSPQTINLKSSSDTFGFDAFGPLKERVGSRIFSRLLESSLFLELDGSDYRKMRRGYKH